MSENETNPTPQPPAEPAKAPSGPVNLKALAKGFLDHLAVLANEVKALPEAKKPVEALQNITRGFDKLALRAAREACILADAEKPSQVNPLIQVTALNVASRLKVWARDIEQGAAAPKSWEDLGKGLAEEVKLSKAVQEVISQTGVAATVAIPGTPLTTPDGKPLADS
jgi:hypothetical protein